MFLEFKNGRLDFNIANNANFTSFPTFLQEEKVKNENFGLRNYLPFEGKQLGSHTWETKHVSDARREKSKL